jgi:transposase
VIDPTGSQRDAASVLFNLPGYRVLDAVDDPGGGRRVVIESLDVEGACPACGVLTSRVHQRTRQRVRDVPVAGAVVVVWDKRRFSCQEVLCPKRTFTEHTGQVPPRARSTGRLLEEVLAAVTTAGRTVSEVARAHQLAWWTVQTVLNAAAVLLAAEAVAPVRRLGIDEHRYRSVRYFRDPATSVWSRVEPWMTTFVDLDTAQVLGIVDGRDSAGVGAWLQARPPAWCAGVQVVAIDPSAAFRKALRDNLSQAAVSVDHFHLVKLGNDMVTTVRQRLTQQTKGRRGRTVDASWANRRLLLRAGDTLTPAALERLKATFRRDDPTDELGAAWGVKEQLRRLLRTASLDQAHTERMRLGAYVLTAAMPETDRLWATVNTWWPEIEVLVVTGVTNAKTEAANTGIKHIKRSGRGFRNETHYRARILLASAARRAA